MTVKKEAAAAEEKDTAVSRKAYGMAQKALREAHADEFATLLDSAYDSLGLRSPRIKRLEREEIAAVKKREAAVKREERRVAKIEKLRAELAAIEGDPLF
jgi:hypothetical protein